MQNAIDSQFGKNKAIVIDNGDGTFTVSFIESSRRYNITNNGIQESRSWKEIFENSRAPENQTKKDVIGIGTNGDVINMDLWEYSYDSKTNGYGLNSSDVLNNSENGGNNSTKITKAGYLGKIENGKIIGTIPAYIKEKNGEWIAVTSLYKTFQANATNNDNLAYLTIPPVIPNTVENMMATFVSSNITKMPIIPNKVTNMISTFNSCSKLIETSTIPESVRTMNYCFNGCTSLIETPDILDGVIEFSNTFNGCSKLTNVKKLPNSIKNMSATFKNCITLENMILLPQNVEILNNTFDGCTLLKNGPTIVPNTVTTMVCTFINCSNLQGNIMINANIQKDTTYDGTHTYYYMCFSGATTKNNIHLIVSGECEAINEMVATKNENSNISL